MRPKRRRLALLLANALPLLAEKSTDNTIFLSEIPLDDGASIEQQQQDIQGTRSQQCNEISSSESRHTVQRKSYCEGIPLHRQDNSFLHRQLQDGLDSKISSTSLTQDNGSDGDIDESFLPIFPSGFPMTTSYHAMTRHLNLELDEKYDDQINEYGDDNLRPLWFRLHWLPKTTTPANLLRSTTSDQNVVDTAASICKVRPDMSSSTNPFTELVIGEGAKNKQDKNTDMDTMGGAPSNVVSISKSSLELFEEKLQVYIESWLPARLRRDPLRDQNPAEVLTSFQGMAERISSDTSTTQNDHENKVDKILQSSSEKLIVEQREKEPQKQRYAKVDPVDDTGAGLYFEDVTKKDNPNSGNDLQQYDTLSIGSGRISNEYRGDAMGNGDAIVENLSESDDNFNQEFHFSSHNEFCFINKHADNFLFNISIVGTDMTARDEKQDREAASSGSVEDAFMHDADSESSLEDTEKKQAKGNQTQSLNDIDDAQVNVDSIIEEVDAISTEKIYSDKEDVDADDDEKLYERVSVDYASKSAGALIIEKSSNFKGTSNLLNGDRDKYAITPCSEEKKFVVLSLSEDILVKVIKLANYERFSSTVKDFQVLGSQTLGKWIDFGVYSASSGNGEQTFPLKTPTWARYLKFKFLTHHGVEYYCTLSQIIVHGSTMVQGFHEQWEMIEESNEDDSSHLQDDQSGADLKNADISNFDTKVTSGCDGKSRNESMPFNETSRQVALSENEEHAHNNCHLEADGQSCSTDDYQLDAIPSFENFHSSSTLFKLLLGEVEDEHIINDYYDRIPSALSVIPPYSRKSAGRNKHDLEPKIIHRISFSAMLSSYASSRPPLAARDLMVPYENHKIVSPKMNDVTPDVAQERFGKGIPSEILSNLSGSLSSHRNEITDAPDRMDNKTGDRPPELIVTVPESSVVEISPSFDTKSTHNVKKNSELEVAVEHDEVVSVLDSENSMDSLLVMVLKDLPSAECLGKLDFSSLKARISVARKSSGGSSSPQGSGMIEPIFKKLTDEIFALQTSLYVHDQFTKESVACYRRVLLDLAMELEKINRVHEERLSRLEQKLFESIFSRFFNYIISLVSLSIRFLAKTSSALYTFLMNDWLFPFERVCGTIATRTIMFVQGSWDAPKGALWSLERESSWRRTIALLVEHLDHGFYRLGTAPSTLTSYYEEGMWTFPVVPVLIVLLLCRVAMCCTSTSTTRTYAIAVRRMTPTRRNCLSITSDEQPSTLKSSENRKQKMEEGVGEQEKFDSSSRDELTARNIGQNGTGDGSFIGTEGAPELVRENQEKDNSPKCDGNSTRCKSSRDDSHSEQGNLSTSILSIEDGD